MRSLIICLAIASSSAASAAGPGENFFGYWTWHAPGHLEQRTSPRHACLDLVADLNGAGTPASYRGVSASADPSARDYTCLWKHDDPPYANDQSINAAISFYVCPSNATAISLGNSGLAVDFRCRCDSGTCVSPSPPAVDQTARCRKGPATSLKSTAVVAAESAQNASLAQSADPAFAAEYSVIAAELDATEACTFARADMYPDGPHTVNIGYLCGFRAGDEAAANNVAGYPNTPNNYVWHHDLAMGRLRLVTQAAHRRCGAHIGGVAAWKEALGLADYPFTLPPLY